MTRKDKLVCVLDRLEVAIGTMLVVTDREGCLRALDWADYEPRMHRLLRLHYGADGVTLREGRMPDDVRASLISYFAGDLSAIAAIRTATGGTEFQRLVWAALREIPAGET